VIRAAFCRIDLIDRAGWGWVALVSTPPGQPGPIHTIRVDNWQDDPEGVAQIVADVAKELCS
jgi:hypothetical protein